SLDRSACGQTIFNSLNNPLSGTAITRDMAKAAGSITISSFLSNSLAGNVQAASIVGFLAAAPPPFVRLNEDPCDPFTSGGCPGKGQAPVPDFGPTPAFAASPTLNQVLTDEQEALLGCGHFWGTDCEVDGIDLLNAEASVLLQSFTGYAGVY